MATDRFSEAFHHVPGHAELYFLATGLLLPTDSYFLEEQLRSWAYSDAVATAFAEFERDFLTTASDDERDRLPMIDGDLIKEYRILAFPAAPRRPGRRWPPRKDGWTAGHHAMWFCSQLHELTLRGRAAGRWQWLARLDEDELWYGDALGRVLEMWVAGWEARLPPREAPFAVSRAEIDELLDQFDSDGEEAAGGIIAYGDQVRRGVVDLSTGPDYPDDLADPADRQSEFSDNDDDDDSSMGSEDDSDGSDGKSDDGDDDCEWGDDEEPDEGGEPCSKPSGYSRSVPTSEPLDASLMDETSDYDSDDESLFGP